MESCRSPTRVEHLPIVHPPHRVATTFRLAVLHHLNSHAILRDIGPDNHPDFDVLHIHDFTCGEAKFAMRVNFLHEHDRALQPSLFITQPSCQERGTNIYNKKDDAAKKKVTNVSFLSYSPCGAAICGAKYSLHSVSSTENTP